jgi:multisubunit Na+/H+ antiporter MnhC subunit
MLRGSRPVRRLFTAAVLLIAAAATGHVDPIAPVILGVTGILFFAVIGRFAAKKMNQPSVFASIGKSLGVFTDELFSALVLVVIVTTLLTPPFLKLTLYNNKPTKSLS